MEYWVCEIASYPRVRIHEESCRYCPAPPTSAKGTQWHGAFNTLEEAIKKARAIGHPESRGCPNCLPNVGLLWRLVPSDAPGSPRG